jgi:hypothetical protein
MAGFWIKFDTSTSDKPEVWQIAADLGIDPDAVVGKLLRVWAWFDDQTENGNAPLTVAALLDRRVGVSGFVTAMISAGWMISENGVLSLPNFERHNGETAKSRALTAKRVAKHKEKGVLTANATANAPLTLGALPKAEQKRAEQKNTHTHTPARRSEAIIPDDLAEPWERWQSFREAIDGRRIPDVQAETILMELGRRGTEKAIRDIEFSICKSARTILDSDNDFEKRAAPNGRQPNPNKELV